MDELFWTHVFRPVLQFRQPQSVYAITDRVQVPQEAPPNRYIPWRPPRLLYSGWENPAMDAKLTPPTLLFMRGGGMPQPGSAPELVRRQKTLRGGGYAPTRFRPKLARRQKTLQEKSVNSHPRRSYRQEDGRPWLCGGACDKLCISRLARKGPRGLRLLARPRYPRTG